MFYSHFHLKKTGRFGLIWLAATQSKVLSKREIVAVNVMGSCNEILRHIPMRSGEHGRASRFSLYLCCQLLYGTVKVLQKQWDYLLVDVSACYKRCIPDCHAIEIELGAPRYGVTLESRVPTDKISSNFDPFFGISKDSTLSIETVLNNLDSSCKGQDLLVFEKIPPIVQPDISSPHSVSDPREIQICDLETSQLSITLPEEPDLPRLDHAALTELLSPIKSPAQELEGPIFFQELAPELHDVLNGDTSLPGRIKARVLEETPLSKPVSGMPAPPRKPRPGGQRKTQIHTETDRRKEDTLEVAPQGQDSLFTDMVVAVGEPMNGTGGHETAQTEQDRAETQRKTTAHGHDWEQRNPPAVYLSPVLTEQSPLRKRRPHKLIIDSTLMISKPEMQQHMRNTEDIISPMVLQLGTHEKRHFYKDPAHDFLRQNKELSRLFTRNCKFGLRMEDSGSERGSTSSPSLLDVLMKRKRTRKSEDKEIPSKVARLSEELPSIEYGRDASGNYLHSFDIEKNLSHSTVAQSGDESITSIRRQPSLLQDKDVSRDNNSMLLQDISTASALLSVWPEELELNVSAVPVIEQLQDQLEVTAQNGDLFVQNQMPVQLVPENYGNIAEKSLDGSSSDGVLKLINHHLRSHDDMTTFRSICPPSQYSRNAAASFFADLCYQVFKQRVLVRQEEPYGEIHIWLPPPQEV